MFYAVEVQGIGEWKYKSYRQIICVLYQGMVEVGPSQLDGLKTWQDFQLSEILLSLLPYKFEM